MRERKKENKTHKIRTEEENLPMFWLLQIVLLNVSMFSRKYTLYEDNAV